MPWSHCCAGVVLVFVRVALLVWLTTADLHQVDNRHQREPVISPEQAARVCDRNFGVGGDGVQANLLLATPVWARCRLQVTQGMRRSFLRSRARAAARTTPCASTTPTAASPRCAGMAYGAWRDLWQTETAAAPASTESARWQVRQQAVQLLCRLVPARPSADTPLCGWCQASYSRPSWRTGRCAWTWVSLSWRAPACPPFCRRRR